MATASNIATWQRIAESASCSALPAGTCTSLHCGLSGIPTVTKFRAQFRSKNVVSEYLHRVSGRHVSLSQFGSTVSTKKLRLCTPPHDDVVARTGAAFGLCLTSRLVFLVFEPCPNGYVSPELRYPVVLLKIMNFSPSRSDPPHFSLSLFLHQKRAGTRQEVCPGSWNLSNVRITNCAQTHREFMVHVESVDRVTGQS